MKSEKRYGGGLTVNEYIVKTISAMSEVSYFVSNVSHMLCFHGLMKKILL